MIIGAGFSRAAAPSNASVARRPPLDFDFCSVASAISRKEFDQVKNYVQSTLGDYSEQLLQSLETTTTFLYQKALSSSPRSDAHNAFLSMLSLLGKVLANTTNPLQIGPRSLIYRFFLNEISRLSNPEHLSIITFNYDLVIERTLSIIGEKQHFDAFSFPNSYRLTKVAGTPGIHGLAPFPSSTPRSKGITLLKLHGSMNWQSVHTSTSPNPSALLQPNRELNVVNAMNIGADLSWTRKRRRVYLKPIIVPPVSGKRGMMHNVVQELWGIAANLLREADRIVITGYSCPPLDLEARFLISENLRANTSKRVYVIDPNAEVAARYVDLCGVEHLTIYSSIKAWVADAKNYTSV